MRSTLATNLFKTDLSFQHFLMLISANKWGIPCIFHVEML